MPIGCLLVLKAYSAIILSFDFHSNKPIVGLLSPALNKSSTAAK